MQPKEKKLQPNCMPNSASNLILSIIGLKGKNYIIDCKTA